MAIFPQGLTNIDRRCDTGERAVLHQLKRCLSDDYMVWHNVPIGPKARQPDFVILSPRRGLLILEVKHWAWSTLLGFNRDSVELRLEDGPKTVAHPLSQARGYQLDTPQDLQGDAYWQALVHTVNRAVQTGLVPGGQYLALLIDEAHDFDETWLQMAARMVNPASNSLLVLYDDAQSIYQKQRRKFSFASVGIQAQGRTSVLKLNYRNTAEVLALAMQCAANLVAERPESEDAVQTVHPATAGRRGPLPVLIEATNPAEEAELIAERVAKSVSEGKSLNDIAVLFRTRIRIDGVSRALHRKGIAVQAMQAQGATRFDWSKPSVKLITLHSAKGLEFPLVFIAGLDSMPWRNEPLEEEVRLLYVGMTRSTQVLVLTAAGTSPIVQRVKNSLEVVSQQFTGS